MEYAYSSVSKISYEKLGQGPISVLFLHGLGGSSHTWDYLRGHLAESTTFSSYLINLKGHGYSSVLPGDDYSIASQADMVASFISDVIQGDTILAGNSYGGAIALLVAVGRQEKAMLRGLFLANPAAFAERMPIFVMILQNNFLASLIGRFVPARMRAKSALRYLYGTASRPKESMIGNYAKFLDGGHWKSLLAAARNIVPPEHALLVAKYSKIAIPTAIVWGKKDPALPKDTAERLCAAIPHASLSVIPEAGHMPQEECPEEVLSLLESFAASIR